MKLQHNFFAWISCLFAFTFGYAVEEGKLPPGYEPAAGIPDVVAKAIPAANNYEFGGAADKEFQSKVLPNIPTEPIVKPSKPRKLLLHHNPRHLRHISETLLRKAIVAMGEKTGAYETTLCNDFEILTPEKLATFDAVFISISVGYPAEKLPAVLDYVRKGGGWIAVHLSVDAFVRNKDDNLMMGGRFTGHPFGGKELVLRNEQPGHPLTALFPAEFPFTDEIFHFADPYSRDRMTILLSVNYEKSVNAHPIAEKLRTEKKVGDLRDDNDYAVSWVREEGKGRVFFTSLGHEIKTISDPRYLSHILAAIQYARGDVPAPVVPRQNETTGKP